MSSPVRLCLTGDVMCGRGIDQILRHPGDPEIFEPWADSALRYVELAEQRSGPLPRAVDAGYVWGDALGRVPGPAPDAFVVNLETAVTDRGTPWPGKPIQYRMHPANVDCLRVAGIDVAVLANNHVLDWSRPGLVQTLDVVTSAGVATAGAGLDAATAWAPATIDTGGGRVLVLGVGTTSSGIPAQWAAGEGRPGVALIPDLSPASVDRVAGVVAATSAPGDVVVVSIHWGTNWGYDIGWDRRRFARSLVESAGVHVVHGHSSHHPLGIEVHRGRLILYGCGDLLTDYEGIAGHEDYRGELSGLYLATLDGSTGTVERLEIVPTSVERFRLRAPRPEDLRWLADRLDRECSRLSTRVSIVGDRLVVDW